MSENITHTGVVDDALRLALHSAEICEAFKQVIREHQDMTQLGCMTRAGDACNPGLLATFRERWEMRNPGDLLEPKLAFVLGWLCHRAADRQMKPVFRRFHPPGTRKEAPTECSVYHDAFIFHEIYAGGWENPCTPVLFGKAWADLSTQDNIDIDGLSALTRVLLRRGLIEMHTLIPDVENSESWIGQLYQRKQDFYVNLGRYDAAITHPDPDKLKTYIYDDNFYDRDEAIINTATRLRKGESLDAETIAAAIAAPAHSHYGVALQIAFKYVQAASNYFAGKIDMPALKVGLDIGIPGSDGQAV